MQKALLHFHVIAFLHVKRSSFSPFFSVFDMRIVPFLLRQTAVRCIWALRRMWALLFLVCNVWSRWTGLVSINLPFDFFYRNGRFFYDTYFAYKMRNFAIDWFFTFNCLYRNSCSKSAIVTAIFNERAEILPRDHNCFILCLKVCLKMSILEYPFLHSQSASCGHNWSVQLCVRWGEQKLYFPQFWPSHFQTHSNFSTVLTYPFSNSL